MQLFDIRLRERYPARDLLLPTVLGNALRAGELRSVERYGLDALVVWPRLYPLLSERLTGLLTAQRNQVDAMVSFTAMFLAIAVLSAAALTGDGWWSLLAAGALAMAAASYTAAVAAAVGYGYLLEVAFDLHRFDLLRAMRQPLPATLEEERELNTRLSDFLRGPQPRSRTSWLRYADPQEDQQE
ncbi:hypothetical protein [Microbispora sp. H10830]|uniref:hypothetical protein n=1 Tax=Microbispora sp. H10830 TaxID=2729109 RepID=UPI0016003F81|nr:hypothetical protein [Microbispora sp. H10830]